MSGCERTLATSSCSAATWSVTTFHDVQAASCPLAAPTLGAQFGLCVRRQRAFGVRHDQDPLDAQQVHSQHHGVQGRAADVPTGIAEDLRIAGLEPEHPERVDARVHAGDHGDAGVRNTVESGQVERLGERCIRRQ